MNHSTLTFHGAAGTVTGSKTLLQHGEDRVLIDCGMFQGLKADRERNWKPFPFAVESLAAIVITHAHIDHSGALPLAMKHGFQGDIYCSPGTAELLEIMLRDSARLQEEEATFRNRHGWTKHTPALPLFTMEDAEDALRRIQPVPYEECWKIGALEFSFHAAGHIIGSAHLRVQAPDTSVLFSGDLGRDQTLLFGKLPPRPEADVIVCEATYGERRHPPIKPEDELYEAVRPILKREGVALMPAFAVGRAQELLAALELLFQEERLPRCKVFLDTPMGAKALEATVNAYPELSERGVKLMDAARKHTVVIGDTKESQALNSMKGPAVIVSASGMLVGGRILHHLMARAANKQDGLIIGGFQAMGTRGRRLADGETPIKIFGRPVDIELEVSTLSSFSAHPDHEGILAWIGSTTLPRRVIFNHGEPSAISGILHGVSALFPEVHATGARLDRCYPLSEEAV